MGPSVRGVGRRSPFGEVRRAAHGAPSRENCKRGSGRPEEDVEGGQLPMGHEPADPVARHIKP